MLDAILKYFSGWLLARLTAILDPEGARRAQALIDRGKALDLQEADVQREAQLSAQIYNQHVAARQEWERLSKEVELQNAASKERYEAAQSRIKARDEETAKLNQVVLDRTTDSAFQSAPK